MTSLPSPSRETATGVQTNGQGQRTTAHLNLTRSLADVFARKTAADFETEKKAAGKRKRQLEQARSRPRSQPKAPPYAGYDQTERAWE
jgi:predicted DNA-binding WGR domain protein